MPSYQKDDPSSIQAMFGSIASRYDKTNGILSFQMHKRWNRQLVNVVVNKQEPAALVDLCCGTGDIAFDYLKRTKSPCHAYLVDFCAEMLECSREKSKKLPSNSQHLISYIQADVQHIPLPPESMDCATMAYGIRNVKDPSLAMKEVFRLLKKGGQFGILELTQPSNPILSFAHRLYLRFILPLFGKLLTNNQDAYQYLCNSIQSFIAPKALESMLQQSGFVNTRRIPLLGGIATIIIGQKK